MIARALAAVLVLAPAVAAAAPTNDPTHDPTHDPAKDRAALGQFEAAYQATARLTGAARTNQACQDADRLHTAGGAFSSDTAPADAPVDDETWSRVAGGLVRSLAQLAEVCHAPDRKLDLIGKVKTADQVVQELGEDVATVLDAARPRTLSPALGKAQTALAAIRASTGAVCKQLPKFVAALHQAAKPPAGVLAAAWKEPYQATKNIATDLKPAACGKHRAADEQIGSSLEELHDNFYKLVLLVPPR